MKGFVQDIEGLAVKNSEFRRVALYGKGLPTRRHGVKAQGRDRGRSPQARPVLSRGRGGRRGGSRWSRTAIKAGFAVVVPAGAKHNIINTGSIPLKLYTLYAPPNHRDGVVHHTRADAEADNEHFDGKTTE